MSSSILNIRARTFTSIDLELLQKKLRTRLILYPATAIVFAVVFDLILYYYNFEVEYSLLQFGKFLIFLFLAFCAGGFTIIVFFLSYKLYKAYRHSTDTIELLLYPPSSKIKKMRDELQKDTTLYLFSLGLDNIYFFSTKSLVLYLYLDKCQFIIIPLKELKYCDVYDDYSPVDGSLYEITIGYQNLFGNDLHESFRLPKSNILTEELIEVFQENIL
jgi:hypothetical protein